MRVPRSVRMSCSFCSWVSMTNPSICVGAGGAHHRSPALELGGDESRELLRVEVTRLDALGAQPLAHVGEPQRAAHLGVQLGHDLGGQAREIVTKLNAEVRRA